jgi:hypothetical protein
MTFSLRLGLRLRSVRAMIGHRVGRKVLAEVATVARPETILTWYRNLVARKSMARRRVEARAGLGSSERLSS